MRRLADYKALYKLSKDLLKGGCAEVFMATRRSDEFPVALKRPRKGPQDAGRLQREIEVQSSLAHPNIMPILDADPDKGWFVMPRALGNLEDRRNEVDEEEFSGLLMGAADALAVAHEGGHFHRDLEPANILALPSPQGGRKWVIADWGLVTRPYHTGSSPLTKAGGLGTEGYTAPEVMADGRRATASSDVYSLGRIAEWYLTGQNPVPGTRVLPEGDQGHWRAFVRACTEPEASRRADLATFRRLLDEVFTLGPVRPASRAPTWSPVSSSASQLRSARYSAWPRTIRRMRRPILTSLRAFLGPFCRTGLVSIRTGRPRRPARCARISYRTRHGRAGTQSMHAPRYPSSRRSS